MEHSASERLTAYRPTGPPAGRLVRLGVVLDRRSAADRLRQVATMCELARIDAVWLRDDAGADRPPLDVWAALAVVAGATARVRLGMMIDVRAMPSETLAARVEALDHGLRRRLEIGVGAGGLRRSRPSFGSEDEAALLRAVEACAVAIRRRGVPVSVDAVDPAFLAAAARVADDIVLPATPIAETRAALVEVQRVCEATGRAAESLGLGLEVPVSVGRTSAEAQARAEAETRFRTLGHPAEVGIFGRLEQCQDRVIELAHLGVTDLRCVLPDCADVHDVIAQLTAMVVGSAAVLAPHASRSKAPGPPEGWGGRREGA